MWGVVCGAVCGVWGWGAGVGGVWGSQWGGGAKVVLVGIARRCCRHGQNRRLILPFMHVPPPDLPRVSRVMLLSRRSAARPCRALAVC